MGFLREHPIRKLVAAGVLTPNTPKRSLANSQPATSFIGGISNGLSVASQTANATKASYPR